MGTVETEVHRHSLLMLGSSAGMTFIGVLATMFYAHWLGAEVLGAYFLFLSTYNLLALLSDLGFNAAALKRISEGVRPDAFFTLSLVIRFVLLFGVVSLLMVAFRYRFVDLNNAGLFWPLIVVFGIGTLSSCLSTAIGGANRLGLSASMSILDNVTRIAVQFALVLLGFRVFGLVGGVAAGLLVEIVIALRYIDFRIVRVRLEQLRSMVNYSVWAFLAASGVAVMDNANVILIGYFMESSDVGIFGICWTFSFFALFVSTALSNTLWVKVSRWGATGDRDAIALSLSRSCSYALLFAIPILAGGVILGRDLLYYLYSASFAAGFGVLVILLLARTMQSISQLFYTFLMALDAARDGFTVVLAGSATNLVLSLALIPVLGLPGAAAGSLAAVVVCLVLAAGRLRRLTPVRLDLRALMRFLGSAAVMSVVVLAGQAAVPIHSFVKPLLLVVVGAGVYFGILLAADPGLRGDARRTLHIRWWGEGDGKR